MDKAFESITSDIEADYSKVREVAVENNNTSIHSLFQNGEALTLLEERLFIEACKEGDGEYLAIPLKNGVIYTAESVLEERFKFMQALKDKLREELAKSGTELAPSWKFIHKRQLDDAGKEIARSFDGSNLQGEVSSTAAQEKFLEFVQKGYDYRATDIHFVLTDKLYVHYRVDKDMRPELMETEPRDIGRRVIAQAINTNRGGGDINHTSPQSVSFKVKVTDKNKGAKTTKLRLRGEKVPIDSDRDENALALYVRLIKTDIPPTMQELGVDEPLAAAMKRAMQQPKGMVLVTGPTSSGKTTLMGAGIHEFPKNKSMRTIEDPVELKLDDISEYIIQMSQDKSRWDEFLMSILRQDPDAIYLGETRSLMQANTLISATNTGHLTITTLHTNSAVEIIQRFIDMGVKLEDILVDKLLLLLVATRLVPKTCQNCSLDFDELPIDKQLFVRGLVSGNLDQLRFANIERVPCRRHSLPSQCSCLDGVKGMESVAEFIEPTPEILNYIRKHRIDGLEQWLRSKGWKSLKDVAMYKVSKGIIDLFLIGYEIQGIYDTKSFAEKFKQYDYYTINNGLITLESGVDDAISHLVEN